MKPLGSGLGMPVRNDRISAEGIPSFHAGRTGTERRIQSRVGAGAAAIVALALSACHGSSSKPTPPPPPALYTIGGTVNGLSGAGLVLRDNGGDNLAVSGNGPFTFAAKVNFGGAYAVTVMTQPSNPAQTCTVANSSGTASGNVTNVVVSCTTAASNVTIGGTVTGLSGTVVLEDNGGDDLSVTENGSFTFATHLASGTAYAVTVLTQPTGQTCMVTDGTGTTGSSNVTTVAVSCTNASAPATYKIVEIPRLTSAGAATANAVNSAGVLVGDYEPYCTPDCGGQTKAWMYQQSSGALNELIFDPSETYAAANGVSEGGIIAGAAATPQTAGPAAVYWTVTGGSVPLAGCGSCWAVAANTGGTIVGGWGAPGSPGSGALLWTPPGYAMSTLPGLRCDYCARAGISTAAINVNGTVVGSSMSSIYDNGQFVSGGSFAAEWQSGTVTSLGSLQNSGASAAYGINDGGDIVGGSRVGSTAGAPTHAFLYHQGAMIDLGTLSGDVNSAANAINNAGVIVGASDDGTVTRAFVYESGKMYDLNALIDATDPLAGVVTFREAVSVSGNGWIAVNGTDSRDSGENAGAKRAFLLIPSH